MLLVAWFFLPPFDFCHTFVAYFLLHRTTPLQILPLSISHFLAMVSQSLALSFLIAYYICDVGNRPASDFLLCNCLGCSCFFVAPSFFVRLQQLFTICSSTTINPTLGYGEGDGQGILLRLASRDRDSWFNFNFNFDRASVSDSVLI